MLADSTYDWYSLIACFLLILIFFTTVYHWSCSNKWTEIHQFAIVFGGSLTYIWSGVISFSIFGLLVIGIYEENIQMRINKNYCSRFVYNSFYFILCTYP